MNRFISDIIDQSDHPTDISNQEDMYTRAHKDIRYDAPDSSNYEVKEIDFDEVIEMEGDA